MNQKRFFVTITLALLLLISAREIPAQSPAADGHRFEVGGQFSVLNNSVINEASATSVQCVNIPCPPMFFSFSKSRKIQPGFGGRFGYNLTDNLALEGELNFIPKANSFNQPDAFNDGRSIEGLFGLKAGKRFKKVGVFGKARPGFLYATKGDLQANPRALCPAVFPPPVGCFETTSKNSFAFDFGGVVELYPTRRTIIRFDVGDTIIRLDKRNVSAVLNPQPGSLQPSRLVVISVPAETTQNLQVSAGIGFRF
jgi:hypothetical protein